MIDLFIVVAASIAAGLLSLSVALFLLRSEKLSAKLIKYGTPFAAGVLLIQCSMPSAVLNYLVASIYSPKKVIDSVASTIVVSTLMSFFTIPLVVFFSLKYFY